MTLTVGSPRLANKPTAAGVTNVPLRKAGLFFFKSSPHKRRLSPALSMLEGTVICSGVTLQSSCGTTVSSPLGMMAPVMILTHSPALTVPCQALPARAVPTTFSTKFVSALSCVPSKAKPSMAELSCGGTSTGLMASAAMTRLRASKMATSSVSCKGVTNCARKFKTSCAGKACGS